MFICFKPQSRFCSHTWSPKVIPRCSTFQNVRFGQRRTENSITGAPSRMQSMSPWKPLFACESRKQREGAGGVSLQWPLCIHTVVAMVSYTSSIPWSSAYRSWLDPWLGCSLSTAPGRKALWCMHLQDPGGSGFHDAEAWFLFVEFLGEAFGIRESQFVDA